MTQTAGSPTPSARRVRRAAVVTHGKAAQIGSGLARLQAVAAEHGVELLVSAEEAAKHGVPDTGEDENADLAVVLGGDGTVLRALTRFLGTGVPVVGVNFGRVGFLSSIGRRDLELGLGRVFEGEYDVVELPTLELEHPDGRAVAVNDVVVTSAGLGRMIELELAVGGEELGRQPCDGIICSTPSGSTAYNLSNGGPVLMWGLEAIALTYVAAHSLRARPLVIPPGADVIVWNRSADVEAGVLVDGHRVSSLGKAERAVVRIADERSLLATLAGGDLRAPLSPELRLVSDGRLALRDGRTLAWHEYGPPAGVRSCASRERPVRDFRDTPTRTPTTGSTPVSSSSTDQATARRRGFPAAASRRSRTTQRSFSTTSGSTSVHAIGGSGGGPHVLAFAGKHPARVRAATVVVGGTPLEEEEDTRDLIQLNRDAWHAAHQSWEALYALLAPLREKILADPLAGFRHAMEGAPASDQAVLDDPDWQRVFAQDVTEAFRPGAEGWTDEGMALTLAWDFEPSDVACSVTWWHGANDANAPLGPVRRLLETMRGRRSARVGGRRAPRALQPPRRDPGRAPHAVTDPRRVHAEARR